MARPSTLDYDEIKREVESKGVEVIDVNTSSGRLAIYYKCTNCGQESQINYVNYNKGQNSKFLCKRCQALKGPKMQRIQEYFDSMGVPIESVDFFDETGHSLKHWVIHFNCSRCGNPHTIIDDYVGKNNKELCCPNCMTKKTVPTQGSLEEYFKSRGSELLSKYAGYHKPLKFKCVKCGDIVENDLAHLRHGYNPRLYCRACNGNDSSREFFSFADENKLEVLGDYTNAETPILIRCTRCGEPFEFDYGGYKWLGNNKYILCSDCRNDFTGRDPSKFSTTGRNGIVADFWPKYVREFFNIPTDQYGDYRAHHIIRYTVDTDYQTSILNGYPLKKELHSGNNAYYHSGDGRLVSNWSDAEKLPYHNYSGFRFLDLNSKFVTEILYPTENMGMKYLYKKKKEFADRGLLYIPFYLTDMQTKDRRKLIYSMIRNRISGVYPDIYNYTGTKVIKYYARKLEVKVIEDSVKAEVFFNSNHIQGSVGCSIYIGLFDGDDIISCMGFTKQRYMSKDQYDYELARFATKRDTIVIGGASKLFKNFIELYNPESVVSFCDLRFSSMNPNNTVYAKLGFNYVGYSEPNYWYRDPKTGLAKNRRSFQKYMLENKLEIFDSNLSETQNMEMNGFIRQVDCGNYKYVWTKK